MLIGVPREIKNHEYRVGLTPAGVRELSSAGHQILIEQDAGTDIGLSNEDYRQAGAELVDMPEEIFKRAELIVKVKEPLAEERQQLRENQTLFTYLHLAPDAEQTHDLIQSGATCIAYETVTDAGGGLPLLAPMSEVAGRMAIQAAAHALEKTQGGIGVLIGGVPGVSPANVYVIGGGVVGINAARMAMGLGADVTIMDKSIARLKTLDEQFGPQLKTIYATSESIEQAAKTADIIVGAVLLPGAKAPRLISREMLKDMKNGSVLVDVSIDQGGCFESSRPTTHDQPTYHEHGVIHYCVANMPGAVARTSTFALTNATLPFVMALANKGINEALSEDPHLMAGLNIYRGQVTYQAVAEAHGYEYVSPETVLSKD